MEFNIRLLAIVVAASVVRSDSAYVLVLALY
jgi:hypothetical protein